MAWFKIDLSRPNGLGGYRGKGEKPGADWVPGPSVINLKNARLSDDETEAIPIDKNEYREIWIMPAQAKLKKMKEIRAAMRSLSPILLTGTPDEMAAEAQTRVNNIKDVDTAKTMLSQVLPDAFRCIGLLRDLAMVRDDDFEEEES
jgi:hypothetical protein